MTGVGRLPPEIWRMIIRHATATSLPALVYNESRLRGADSVDDRPICLKNDAPLTPVLYHRKECHMQSAVETFSQIGTNRSIALVCRTFNYLVCEYLFEKLYICDPRYACRLAETLESSKVYESPGRWTRHITIVGVFFTYPAASTEFASAAVRILSRTPHLASFHLSWNATSREFRERERMIVGAIPTAELRHFEWDCTGGGFERQPDHPFYQLISSARSKLRVLKLAGYIPLAELPMPPAETQVQDSREDNDSPDSFFPELTHLKIRRAFRDDLLFISQWRISSTLTCLSLGSIWAYFDHRELAFSFWDTPKPALRCLHLGESSNVSISLARKMLRSARGLKFLEYFYLGDWERDSWVGVRHECLEVVKVHVSHPVIALRSLFNNQRFSRDQQWEKILRHISPFLGANTNGFLLERPGVQQQEPHSRSNNEIDDEDAISPGAVTEYPAIKKLVFLEYTRNSEDLHYEPAELAEWLRTRISEADIQTDVRLEVEVEDYIR
ncbi:hypothetical protein A7U60_g1628 [Sanghuangporus baumii]|uniref:Uncharacterized protein n=1 Tax=Sanghuangporus baumii TaxID=108892 RepID=A0A9Q5I416_SANBA|nr:hypothetical protein A7U60_g1628 [Sanghuangporus baumii]